MHPVLSNDAEYVSSLEFFDSNIKNAKRIIKLHESSKTLVESHVRADAYKKLGKLFHSLHP